jgi:hypothetical protein
VGPDRQGVSIRDRPRGAPRWRISSRALAAPRLPLHVRARLHGGMSVLLDRSRMASTASPSTWRTTTSRSRRCRGRRSRSCRRTSGGWGGRFPGRPRRRRLQLRLQRLVHRGAAARGASNTTTRAAATRWTRRPVPEPVVQFAATCGTDAPTYARDRPGMSAFVLEDGVVYHTYSTYSRGLDGIWGMYQWLDRAPKGRNETGIWWRRHDEYRRRRSSGAGPCRPWARCRCPAAGRCRWHGCGCPDRRGRAPRRPSSACGS